MKPSVHTTVFLLGIAKTFTINKMQFGFPKVGKLLPYTALKKESVFGV